VTEIECTMTRCKDVIVLIGLLRRMGFFPFSFASQKGGRSIGKRMSARSNLCLETWMPKKRSGWHRKPRRSVKPTSNTYAEELRIQIVMTERTQRRIMQSYSAVSKRASLHSWIWKRSSAAHDQTRDKSIMQKEQLIRELR